MHLNNSLPAEDARVNNLDVIRNRHLKILIVDDEVDFRVALSCNLSEKYDAVVTDVESGNDAVEMLTSGKAFDLIFLDLLMPDMSGTETYTKLKKIDANCSIVMMSSRSDSDEWRKAEKLSGELLSKNSLVEMLAKVLSRVARR